MTISSESMNNDELMNAQPFMTLESNFWLNVRFDDMHYRETKLTKKWREVNWHLPTLQLDCYEDNTDHESK